MEEYKGMPVLEPWDVPGNRSHPHYNFKKRGISTLEETVKEETPYKKRTFTKVSRSVPDEKFDTMPPLDLGVMPAYQPKRRSFRRYVPSYSKRTAMAAFTPRARNYIPAGGPRGWSNRKGELKYLDGLYATNIDLLGGITVLNTLGQGADANTRIGRQIYNKSIRVFGSIEPQDGETVAHYARVMLVWDHQPNSAAISIVDILNSSSSLSQTNLNNRERFDILRDEKIMMGHFNIAAGSQLATTPVVATIDWFVNLKNRKTTYSGTTAGNTTATGALYLITIGNTNQGTGSIARMSTRLRFYDD